MKARHSPPRPANSRQAIGSTPRLAVLVLVRRACVKYVSPVYPSRRLSCSSPRKRWLGFTNINAGCYVSLMAVYRALYVFIWVWAATNSPWYIQHHVLYYTAVSQTAIYVVFFMDHVTRYGGTQLVRIVFRSFVRLFMFFSSKRCQAIPVQPCIVAIKATVGAPFVCALVCSERTRTRLCT